MARHTIPHVINDRLMQADSARRGVSSIQVGSPSWQEWLNAPTTRSFAFHSSTGKLTVRREQRHGTWYWYAYRMLHGRLHKVYLGKPETLTLARLQQVSSKLISSEQTLEIASFAGSRSSAGPSEAASGSLLLTKFYAPQPGTHLVARPRLIQRLNRGRKARLTLLVSPAGWGKTTLLSEWCARLKRQGRPVAWVSLDEDDNDLNFFWTYVFTACNMVQPGLCDAPLALLQAPAANTLSAALRQFLNALLALPTSTILILDNYQAIHNPAIHESLTFVLEHLPPRFHLALASRSEPPLPLTRLRFQDIETELRVADLRFTSQEATMYITRALRLSPESAQLTLLENSTEGWIAGLHLAALSLQSQLDPSTGLRCNQHMLDYVAGEILAPLPAEIQRFLLQTSLLSRLDAGLCDAVCQVNNSQELLNYLAQNDLFLVALDNHQHSYRFHRLFSTILATHLQRKEPELVPLIRSRAERWLEQQEMAGKREKEQLSEPNETRQQSQHPSDPLTETLTQREQAVLDLLSAGASNNEVAQQLVLSVNTVKKHVLNIYSKLHVRSRTQAIARARALNLLH